MSHSYTRSIELIECPTHTAISDALEQLGYDKTYHMREVRKNGHDEKWIDLLDAKFGDDDSKETIKPGDLDDILHDFDVCKNITHLQSSSDWPTSLLTLPSTRQQPTSHHQSSPVN